MTGRSSGALHRTEPLRSPVMSAIDELLGAAAEDGSGPEVNPCAYVPQSITGTPKSGRLVA